MSSFEDACAIESLGMQDLTPFFNGLGEWKALSVPFGPDGELWVGGRSYHVEVKVERVWTGNLYLETWSDYLVRPGWLVTLEADALAYYFLDRKQVYTASMRKLRNWARVNLSDYREVDQKAYEQANRTRGVIVPIEVLQDEVGLKVYSIR